MSDNRIYWATERVEWLQKASRHCLRYNRRVDEYETAIALSAIEKVSEMWDISRLEALIAIYDVFKSEFDSIRGERRTT